MPEQLDHLHAADQLDRLHALAAAFDLRLARAGLSSWHSDSPRRLSLALLEVLGALRGSLDLLAVGAGSDGSASPYIRRDLVPNATTRAAARRAIASTWPYSTAESTNLGVVQRRGKFRESLGTSAGGPATGDGDRSPSLLADAPIGDSAAALAAVAARAADADATPALDEVAASGPLSAI